MSHEWDDRIFDEFILLRDNFRAAKREKDYERVVVLGQQILDMAKSAGFLSIATPVFLKDMGSASLKMGNRAAATKYFENAILNLRSQSGNWQDQINIIQRKLEKLIRE